MEAWVAMKNDVADYPHEGVLGVAESLADAMEICQLHADQFPPRGSQRWITWESGPVNPHWDYASHDAWLGELGAEMYAVVYCE